MAAPFKLTTSVRYAHAMNCAEPSILYHDTSYSTDNLTGFFIGGKWFDPDRTVFLCKQAEHYNWLGRFDRDFEEFQNADQDVDQKS